MDINAVIFAFGLTSFEAEGRDYNRIKLEIITKSSRENELLKHIEEYELVAFIVAYEPREFKDGFLVKTMNKRSIKIKSKDKNKK